MSLNYIPEEILVDNILERLPSKSLVRFMCVCKSWRDIIRSSSFIQSHHDRNSTKRPCAFLLRCNETELRQYSVILSKDLSVSEAHLKFTYPRGHLFSHTHVGMRVYGSSNGLVCISAYYPCPSSPICIWNPSIGKSRIIPKFSSFVNCRPIINLSFGFHPDHNDYKVVRTLHSGPSWSDTAILVVEIYTLSTNSWKRIDIGGRGPHLLDSGINHFRGSAFLNGIHYLFLKQYEKFRIVPFDTDREEFAEEVIVPHSISSHSFPHILVFKESIGILNFTYRQPKRFIDMWIMKDKSFEQLYTASIPVSLRVYHNLLGFSIDHDELVMQKFGDCDPMIALYNFESNQFHDTGIMLGTKHARVACSPLYAGTYTDSLVLLDD